jgi:nucleoside-diphosphate-sugar epimerase
MARDGALKTAFMSHLFWRLKCGEDVALPVEPESRTWLTSIETVARNFIHAAMLREVGPSRALTLPALSLTFQELVEALKRRCPASLSKISFAGNPELATLFGSHPRLETTIADRLGFTRDADPDALVRNALP